MKETEKCVLLDERKEHQASTKTYDCDSIMWTDDMGVFLKNNTPHSNDDNLSKAL